MIYVTHDQIEAMTLADRIVVMNKGRIEQIGSPLDLYYKPANLFVAGFIGSPKMNQFSAVVRESQAMTGFGLSVPLHSVGNHGVVIVGIRPEHLVIGDADQHPLSARVDLVERLGEISHLHMSFSSGETVIAEWRGRNAPSMGDLLSLHVEQTNIHMFNESGNRLAES